MSSACYLNEANDNMKILKELTNKLPAITFGSGSVVEYKVRNGASYGVGLYNTDKISVQRVFCSKGSEFPFHTHDEYEIIIIYDGEVEFKFDSTDGINNKVYTEKDIIQIEPNKSHSAFAISDFSCICVTIPAAEGYPNGN